MRQNLLARSILFYEDKKQDIVARTSGSMPLPSMHTIQIFDPQDKAFTMF